MQFFLDTGNVDEIKQALEWGILDGVTTNPTLIAKTGRPFMEVVKEILQLVDGPLSPDTAFLNRNYDLFLCMYHDQGLIPFKLLAFREGVNMTVGIPFPRTSPDHGTAYNIAWKGIADISPSLHALRLCERLAKNKK